MEWLNNEYSGNTVRAYLLAVSVIVAGTLVAALLAYFMKRFLIQHAKQTQAKFDDVIASIGVRPVFWIVFTSGLYSGLETLEIQPWIELKIWYGLVVTWSIIGAIAVSRLINGLLEHYVEQIVQSAEKSLYKQLVHTLRSSVGVVVWMVAFVFVISNLGFNVSSILAGLGLGGIAVALASKDTLSNIFGSFTILFNGPFHVGEAVNYQGHEGSVEQISLRDTRIRTWKGHLVVIPNSLAPTSVIENISRRPSFRVVFKLGFPFDITKQKLEVAQQIIRLAIVDDDRTSDKILIHFLEFGQSALMFQVIYYIGDTSKILEVQHSINSRLLSDLEAEQIQLAYPTMTIDQTSKHQTSKTTSTL